MLKTVAIGAGLLVLLHAQQIRAACATVPQLQGEPALVASVAQELTRRGNASGEDCAPLRVRLSRQDGRYWMAIDDSAGRHSERQVATVEMVATLIETWMISGVGELVIAPATPPAVVTAPPPAPPAPSRLVLSGQAESAKANDDSLWMGLAASACVRLGRFCVGALARFADDEGWAATDDVPGARRSVSALLIGSTAISFGRFRLLPRLGLGNAWKWEATARGQHEDRLPPPKNSGWLRAEAGLNAQLLVQRRWAVGLDLSCEIAPGALGAQIGSIGGTRRDPGVFTRLGLGVTWGTP